MIYYAMGTDAPDTGKKMKSKRKNIAQNKRTTYAFGWAIYSRSRPIQIEVDRNVTRINSGNVTAKRYNTGDKFNR